VKTVSSLPKRSEIDIPVHDLISSMPTCILPKKNVLRY
jgi:hypothetical protein